MKRCGFTLVELLVVIAIIALLLAILMPALNKAREQGRAIVCRSNSRNLVIAWLLYAQDFAGNIVGGNDFGVGTMRDPSTGYMRYYYDWVGRPTDKFGNFDPPADTGVTPPVADIERGLQNGALWKYVNNFQAYNCPSDMRRVVRSYSIGCSMNGVWTSSAAVNKQYLPYYYTSVAQIKQASGKIVFVEEDTDVGGKNWGSWLLWGISPSNPYYSSGCDSWGDPASIRHFKRATTVSYADGHVELRFWKDQRTITFFYNGVNRYVPNSQIQPGNPDLQYMESCWPPP